ncbi:hypothetical protein C7974DRAFT_205551 [Boeremia exigua]|uniref:uncharacterized protein n=1 Tax=Boeremia exigua TaxID=749465 RepID=UPI001E8D776F|nr:uncharacterized protein C7974DRAFT_205551 [Boeremia exigua]KAH6625686.1 hypothetical protein C7974DRAFT_205551 [Boeremia exigua]
MPQISRVRLRVDLYACRHCVTRYANIVAPDCSPFLHHCFPFPSPLLPLSFTISVSSHPPPVSAAPTSTSTSAATWLGCMLVLSPTACLHIGANCREVHTWMLCGGRMHEEIGRASAILRPQRRNLERWSAYHVASSPYNSARHGGSTYRQDKKHEILLRIKNTPFTPGAPGSQRRSSHQPHGVRLKRRAEGHATICPETARQRAVATAGQQGSRTRPRQQQESRCRCCCESA